MNKNKEIRFSKIFDENSDKIYRLCRAYLGDSPEVDDLFQEISINVWRGLDSFKGEAKASTWVYRIATNTALLFRKRVNRRTSILATDDTGLQNASSEDTMPQLLERERKFKTLLQAISTLKNQDRIVISLLLDGMSYKQISKVTGLSINHIGVKINRIKIILSKKLTLK